MEYGWIVVGTVAAGFFHVSGLVSALDAVMTGRTSQGSIAWAVSLVTFPYLAVPLYWIFGRSKYRGYVSARRVDDRHVRHIKDHVAPQLPAVVPDLPEARSSVRLMEALAAMPFSRGNDAELLIDGQETFSAIFRAIDDARDYVLAQFYIIKDDGLGREFQARLMDKAGEGVRVHLLYDEIGCLALPGRYLEELRRAGVRVSAFNTTKGIRNRFQLNFRNHRKIVVVDGRVAFVGGLNVGDEYMGRGKAFSRWRDTHACVRGPAVQAVQIAFCEDWYWATHEIPDCNWDLVAVDTDDKSILVIPAGPADDLETCGLFFTHAIHAATERVWITSPYFVPDSRVIAALQIAALRGVDVRILLPERADHLLVWLSSFSFYSETKPYGVKLYRYKPGFLHQKVMLVDADMASVGTPNLDNRSFRLNFEIVLLFLDREFAGRVRTMLERDFDDATLVEEDDLPSRALWFKVAVRAARLMAPLQ